MNLLKSVAISLVLVICIIGAIYVHIEWGPGGYPGEEFFDLAAQTMPILLVALAVEAQARQFDQSLMGKSIRLGAVILLVAGETSAITISANLLDPEHGTATFLVLLVLTAGGLLGGFLGVIAIALFPAPRRVEVRGQARVAQNQSVQAPNAARGLNYRRAGVSSLLAVSVLSALLTRALSRSE